MLHVHEGQCIGLVQVVKIKLTFPISLFLLWVLFILEFYEFLMPCESFWLKLSIH